MFLDDLNYALKKDGAFLIVSGNVMTIGWAMIGTVWYQDIMTIMVRPSRYTYKLLEKNKKFSVCVPKRGEFTEELKICGSKSGKDVDKLKLCNLDLINGKNEEIKILKGCNLFYECEILHEAPMDAKTLKDDSVLKYYPKGDYHKFYNARILSAYKV